MAVAFIRSMRISAVVLLMATALTLTLRSGRAKAQSYEPDGNAAASSYEGNITNPGGLAVQAYFERLLAVAYRDSPLAEPGASWILCSSPGQAARWVHWNGYTRRSSC
jgi:hypothetical protein